jgi:hypothetical protein
MALQQYKQGSTYYGYDPQSQQGIAFSDPTEFQKYFGSFDQNAAAPTFDVSKLMGSPNQLMSLAQPTSAPTAPQQPTNQLPTAPAQQPGGGFSVNSQLPTLEQNYAKLLGPSRDETAADNALKNFQNSYQFGQEKISEKPIPMPFITGQQAALTRTAALQQVPLQQRLAAAQAQRQAALEASRFALERADRQSDIARDESRYQSEVGRQNQQIAQNTQQDATSFAIKYGITAPFYTIDGKTIIRTSDGKAYSTYEDWVKDGGGQGANVQNVSQTIAAQEAAPTTSSTGTKSSGSPGSPSTNLKSTADTSGEIRTWIIANKRANPDIPYYDLWGQLSDELKKQGLNPANYDKVFWEILHPEGLAGYSKYQSGSSSSSSDSIDSIINKYISQ